MTVIPSYSLPQAVVFRSQLDVRNIARGLDPARARPRRPLTRALLSSSTSSTSSSSSSISISRGRSATGARSGRPPRGPQLGETRRGGEALADCGKGGADEGDRWLDLGRDPEGGAVGIELGGNEAGHCVPEPWWGV